MLVLGSTVFLAATKAVKVKDSIPIAMAQIDSAVEFLAQ